MSDALVDLAEQFRASLVAFDPDELSGADCARVVEVLARVNKACAAVMVRCASRATSCGVRAGAGSASGAEWLARTSGTTTGQARAALDTMASLESCPATREQLAAGELSLDQAGEIARTEAAVPGSETELLARARSVPLRQLKERARKRRARAFGPDELHRRQQEARSFRHWTTELGMIGFSGQLPPEVGVPLVNRIDAEAGRIRRQVRRDAAASGPSFDPWERHAADALVELCWGSGSASGSGSGPGSGLGPGSDSGSGSGSASGSGLGSESGSGTRRRANVEMVLVVDLHAYRRGKAIDGEVCHIIGGGPIPVDVAKALAEDAFLKVVLHDGVNIHTVAHLGRHIPAHLRTALELGHPPQFEGATCSEPGCDRRYGLEWDHDDPVAHGGPTSYANLKPRCWPDHQVKTARDRAAGLLAPPPDPDQEVRSDPLDTDQDPDPP